MSVEINSLSSFAIQLVLFILPAYFANAAPVVFGGGAHVDFGKKMRDGQRVFGPGKTWRGLFSGVAVGSLIGLLEAIALNSPLLALQGVLLSVGTMTGDLLGSFIKRRMKQKQGQPSLFLDQLLFLFVALIMAYPVYSMPNAPLKIDVEGVAVLVVLTYAAHRISNWAANKAGLKKVPW